MSWYVKALKQYADFSGRARRTEYWMFTLVELLIGVALVVVAGVVLAVVAGARGGSGGGSGVAWVILLEAPVALYFLGMLLPRLAVTVRRLHDTNRSGAWFFITFVPLIGGIWLLVLLATEGDANHNRYGANPKAVPYPVPGQF